MNYYSNGRSGNCNIYNSEKRDFFHQLIKLLEREDIYHTIYKEDTRK